MKKLLTTLLLQTILFVFVFGQEPQPEQDCIYALPVCIGVYYQENSYEGEGLEPDEINSTNSCLNSGERNSVWYKFSIVNSGDLGFTITPNNLSEDYDWAVYNVTELRCYDIYDNPSMEVSCNYSGTDGITGAVGPPSTETSQGAGGTPDNAFIPVLAGEQYMLHVSNYSSTTNGYTLDLTLSSAQITGPLQEVNLLNVSSVSTDTIAPICGTDELVVFFDLMLDCDLLSGESIALIDDLGNEYEVTDVSSDCQEISGDFYSQWFNLTLDQPLEPSNYELVVYNSDATPVLVDVCGNKAQGVDSDTLNLSFSIEEIDDIFSFISFPIDCKGADDGVIAVNVSGDFPDDLFEINWSNGAQGDFLTNLPPGIYTAEIGTGSCMVVETIEITEPADGMELMNIESTISCLNEANGTVSIVVEGGEEPYEYELNGVSQEDANFEGLAVGMYEGEVSDANGCDLEFEINIEAFEFGGNALSNDSIEVCEDEALMLSAVELEGATEYSWSGPNGFTSTDLIVNVPAVEGSYEFISSGGENCVKVETVYVSILTCVTDTMVVDTMVTDTMGAVMDTTDNTAIPSIAYQQIRVFPNPTKDVLNIEFEALNLVPQLIQVYDVYGQLMMEQVALSNTRLTTNEWTTGIYFIRVCGEESKIEQVFKVVKE